MATRTPKFNSLEYLQRLQDRATDHASQNFTFDDDPQRLRERWIELSAKVAALYREWADLQRESTDRAYGRLYGTRGDDGIKRYKTYDRDGNEIMVTIPT